jgi:hypothetical protein
VVPEPAHEAQAPDLGQARRRWRRQRLHQQRRGRQERQTVHRQVPRRRDVEEVLSRVRNAGGGSVRHPRRNPRHQRDPRQQQQHPQRHQQQHKLQQQQQRSEQRRQLQSLRQTHRRRLQIERGQRVAPFTQNTQKEFGRRQSGEPQELPQLLRQKNRIEQSLANREQRERPSRRAGLREDVPQEQQSPPEPSEHGLQHDVLPLAEIFADDRHSDSFGYCDNTKRRKLDPAVRQSRNDALSQSVPNEPRVQPRQVQAAALPDVPELVPPRGHVQPGPPHSQRGPVVRAEQPDRDARGDQSVESGETVVPQLPQPAAVLLQQGARCERRRLHQPPELRVPERPPQLQPLRVPHQHLPQRLGQRGAHPQLGAHGTRSRVLPERQHALAEEPSGVPQQGGLLREQLQQSTVALEQ